jgi:hypothetical protein
MKDLTQASIVELLACDVRAATNYGADIDVVAYDGPAISILSADAQGSGITNTVKLQSSADLATGASYTTEGTNDIPLLHGAADNVNLAVKFTQSGARQIKQVGLMLKQLGTIAADKTLTLTIEADSSGDPSGTPLATFATVDPATIGEDYELVWFTLATPLDLANNTVYWLVLTGNYDASTENQIQWRTATVASGGNASVYDEAWGAVDTNSREFIVRQYNFADISGAVFTAVGNATSLQTKRLDLSACGGYLRTVSTIAGGSATGALGVSLLGLKQHNP